MKARTLYSNISHIFNVEHEDLAYHVEIWVNEKGKFIDESIKLHEEELEDEELRDEIIDYIDQNWDKLVM